MTCKSREIAKRGLRRDGSQEDADVSVPVAGLAEPQFGQVVRVPKANAPHEQCQSRGASARRVGFGFAQHQHTVRDPNMRPRQFRHVQSGARNTREISLASDAIVQPTVAAPTGDAAPTTRAGLTVWQVGHSGREPKTTIRQTSHCQSGNLVRGVEPTS